MLGLRKSVCVPVPLTRGDGGAVIVVSLIDALGLPVEDLGAEFADFRHPRRPEFLLTLPHVQRTSGFFVARLRRP